MLFRKITGITIIVIGSFYILFYFIMKCQTDKAEAYKDKTANTA